MIIITFCIERFDDKYITFKPFQEMDGHVPVIKKAPVLFLPLKTYELAKLLTDYDSSKMTVLSARSENKA